MVCDRKCKVIVMLSHLVEGGQVSAIDACINKRLCVFVILFILYLVIQEVCYQYWPSRGSQRFGEFTVEVLGEEALQGFVLRTLSVQHSKVSPQLMLRRTMTKYIFSCSPTMLIR